MKTIIFDWSGVVRDSVHEQLYIINRIFNHYGHASITLEEFKQNWRQPYMVFYEKYIPNLQKEEQDKIYKDIAMERKHLGVSPCRGVPELIHKLKEKGFRMFVLSSDLKETLIDEVEKYGLDNIFEEVITSSHDKEIDLRKLIESAKLNKEETYFIGDSNHEIEAGRAVGVKTIAVTWGFTDRDILLSKNPNFLVDTAEELEKILLN